MSEQTLQPKRALAAATRVAQARADARRRPPGTRAPARRRAPLLLVFAVVVLAATGAGGCGGGADDQPCADIATDCAPLFAPEFDAVYRNVIESSCAVSGGACHSAEGAQGGLAFPADDADAAYRALVDDGYVVPGDGLCSELSRRVASDDPDFVMPRGAPLSASAQCAIVQWIDDGAAR